MAGNGQVALSGDVLLQLFQWRILDEEDVLVGDGDYPEIHILGWVASNRPNPRSWIAMDEL